MSSINGTRVRVVPWHNAAEFKKVYEYLYSDEINKKKWAYDTISIWETRCHPSLPTAIEATYVLTSAVIQDILWTNKASLVHHTDLQAIYGSAVTRFVSLVVEVNKNKYTPTYSIAEVAKSIGIPSFIVNIRNEWCHSSRPSLSVLRLSAQSALTYLKDSYWEKEAASINDLVKQPLDDTKLCALFKDYIKFYEDTLVSKKDKLIRSDDGTKAMNPEYIGLLVKLEKYLKKDKRLFVKVLVSEGIFIPTDEDFEQTMSKDNYALFSNEYLEDDENSTVEEEIMDYEQQSYEFEAKNFPEVIEYHENLWGPVIGLLNKYDFVPFFMESLLRTQGSRTLVGQKLLIGWILKILRIHSPATRCFEKSRILKRIFRAKGIVPKVSWLRMLYSAVVNPCKYTLIVLPLIFNNLKIKQEVAHRIIGITAIKLGLVKTEKGQKFFKLFHTVEDLKSALEHQRNGGEVKSAESIGSLCPDDCHKSWPIGYIVNPVKDKDYVEEEELKSIFRSVSEEADVVETCDDSDDEDQEPHKRKEEPNMERVMMEIDRRGTLLYSKRSG